MLPLLLATAAAVTRAADAAGYATAAPATPKIPVHDISGDEVGQVDIAAASGGPSPTAREVLGQLGCQVHDSQLVLDDHHPLAPDQAVPSGAKALTIVRRLNTDMSPEVKQIIADASYDTIPRDTTLPESAEAREALEEALRWQRWDGDDHEIEGGYMLATKLDIMSEEGGRRVLRAALDNPHVNQRTYGIGARRSLEDILEVLEGPGWLPRKVEVVQDVHDSGLLKRGMEGRSLNSFKNMMGFVHRNLFDQPENNWGSDTDGAIEQAAAVLVQIEEAHVGKESFASSSEPSDSESSEPSDSM